jgi:hypothetical protein
MFVPVSRCGKEYVLETCKDGRKILSMLVSERGKGVYVTV